MPVSPQIQLYLWHENANLVPSFLLNI